MRILTRAGLIFAILRRFTFFPIIVRREIPHRPASPATFEHFFEPLVLNV